MPTLGAYDHSAPNLEGSQGAGRTCLRRRRFDLVAEVSIELEAGRHLVDFLEAAWGVVLREPGGELCIAPLGDPQAPFEHLGGGVTPPVA